MATDSNGTRSGRRATAMSRCLDGALRCDLPLVIVSVTLVAVQSTWGDSKHVAFRRVNPFFR